MRILVDTSVWSLAFRRKGPADHRAVETLRAMLQQNEDLTLTGTILQEILEAFRSEATMRKVAAYLEPFPLLDLEREDYRYAARLHRHCAASGVAASTVDCQIATAAIRHETQLLTADRDFERIAELSSLRLA